MLAIRAICGSLFIGILLAARNSKAAHTKLAKVACQQAPVNLVGTSASTGFNNNTYPSQVNPDLAFFNEPPHNRAAITNSSELPGADRPPIHRP